jgi:hypothetical protein
MKHVGTIAAVLLAGMAIARSVAGYKVLTRYPIGGCPTDGT